MDNTLGVQARGASPGLRPEQEVFGNAKNLGGLRANKTSALASAVVLWQSEPIRQAWLTAALNFVIDFAGVISSDGGDDLTLVLQYVENDGTATTLATVVTVSLANEAEKGFLLKFMGRVIDATHIFAVGSMLTMQGTPLSFNSGTGSTDAAGVVVDLAQDGKFQLSGTWDGTGTKTSVTLAAALMNCSSRIGS